jgi:L-alanine-DL-glutamate epimerase-like enolase superfamily enzyme
MKITAISATEQALWDITGKELGVPVYRLLGGACRDKMQLYTHVGGRTPDELARNPIGYVELSTKPGLGIELDMAGVAKSPPQPRDYRSSLWPDGGVADI